MKKKKNYSYDILDSVNSVASATECTGLMQIPPTDLDEAEAYSEIYVIPEQVNHLPIPQPKQVKNKQSSKV